MYKKWRWNIAQFVERRWWQNYLKNKEVQPYLQWKLAYWQGLYDKCKLYFEVNPNDSVLDAGCGPAGAFMLFDKMDTTAFDPLIDTYETDLPHFKKSMYPQIHFVNAGLEDFNSDKQFQVIFCMNAINHVEDIYKSFDKLISLATHGAHLVVTIDAHNYSIFKKLFRMLPGDILHHHQYDLDEYKSMLTDRGCSLLGIEKLKHEFFFDHYMIIVRKAN
ncbi:MAG: methyltransferase domain-containing protein [Chitinophagaceae bacterium]|nr:methyltransferase domain-containing protein [Chitinophagaceae bacterium]